jgi:hypothetical protein
MKYLSLNGGLDEVAILKVGAPTLAEATQEHFSKALKLVKTISLVVLALVAVIAVKVVISPTPQMAVFYLHVTSAISLLIESEHQYVPEVLYVGSEPLELVNYAGH